MHHNPDEEEDSVWDLLIFPDHAKQSTSFQQLLMDFLHRFQETNSHLLGWYESVTHDILVAAAKLQADIPHDSMSSPLDAPSDMSGEATIIALALRCFMDFHILDLIGVDCYGQNVEITSLLEDGSSVEVLMLDDSNPFLTATAYKDDKQQDKLSSILSTKSSAECNFDSDLHTMLSTLAQLSFHLLDMHDPRHWPSVLYVLLILGLSRHCPHIMETLRRSKDGREPLPGPGTVLLCLHGGWEDTQHRLE